jgi:hypothetical protein
MPRIIAPQRRERIGIGLRRQLAFLDGSGEMAAIQPTQRRAASVLVLSPIDLLGDVVSSGVVVASFGTF